MLSRTFWQGVVQLTPAELVARILQSASDSALSHTSSALTRVSLNIVVCGGTAAWISYADRIVRVLIVEDDATIAGFVARGLAEEGFTVDTAHDGRTAFTMATAEHFDLAIVDLMLPEIDGLSLIEQLRAHGITMPVLILTAKRSLDERVEGLQRGGDDYLTKPFAFPELLARVQALLRRAGGRPESARLVVGDLSLDRLRRVVERQGRPIDLRAREFAVLELLMRHAGQVVSKTMILSQVWGYNFDPGSNVVDVAVFRLREKVDKGFDTPMIFTVRGAGYVLKAA